MTGAPVVDAGAVDLGRFHQRTAWVSGGDSARNRVGQVATTEAALVITISSAARVPLLPYSYSNDGVEEGRSAAPLGQDILAQVLRGMQKSMLIICIA